MTVSTYSELIAWQKAMDLVELVYACTKRFPKEELYGLTNQLRRAVVSIPSNIAEGQGLKSTNEFLRYLSIAHGSLREVETQLLIAKRLGYLQESEVRQAASLSSAANVHKLILLASTSWQLVGRARADGISQRGWQIDQQPD